MGDIIDKKYRLTQMLGEGGMGAVYAAEHLILGKQVAIKLLHPFYVQYQEAIQRLYREAKAAAAIGHSGVVEVQDVGWTDSGAPYLVMELLDGESVDDLLMREGGRLSASVAIPIVKDILKILDEVHEKGIIHRDLKPENVYLCPSEGGGREVKILDFGISKITTEQAAGRLTRTGNIVGTPYYMSPEQARGRRDIDHRIDIWAVGAILYEILIGQVPYFGESYNEVLARILVEPVPQPREIEPEMNETLERVILKALARDAEERYGRASEFLADLEALPPEALDFEGTSPLPETPKDADFRTGEAFCEDVPEVPGDETAAEPEREEDRGQIAESDEQGEELEATAGAEESGQDQGDAGDLNVTDTDPMEMRPAAESEETQPADEADATRPDVEPEHPYDSEPVEPRLPEVESTETPSIVTAVVRGLDEPEDLANVYDTDPQTPILLESPLEEPVDTVIPEADESPIPKAVLPTDSGGRAKILPTSETTLYLKVDFRRRELVLRILAVVIALSLGGVGYLALTYSHLLPGGFTSIRDDDDGGQSMVVLDAGPMGSELDGGFDGDEPAQETRRKGRRIRQQKASGDSLDAGTEAGVRLSRSEVANVLRKNHTLFELCLHRVSPPIAKLNLRLRIDGDGTTTYLDSVPDPPETVDWCLTQVVKQAQFRASHAESITVMYPVSAVQKTDDEIPPRSLEETEIQE